MQGGGIDDASSATIPHEDLVHTTSVRAGLVAFAAQDCVGVGRSSIGEVAYLPWHDNVYMCYTLRCDTAIVAALPTTFFPTLFQTEIPKAYELRIFYLAGRCYAMAMFSQASRRTAIDFRRYSASEPTRSVPYRLTASQEANVRTLMDLLELDTGSLDMIVTPDDRYVFLEVNPVGQFGMTSAPCNYNLERLVAEHLERIHGA